MEYALRPATTEDVMHVCRYATVECTAANLALHGLTVLQSVARFLPVSREPTSWLVDGEPACVFGVSQFAALSTTGYPWIVYTPLMQRGRLHFARHCRLWTRLSLEQWKRLEAYVDPRDPNAVKWMQFMGFNLDPPTPVGPRGALFHFAQIERAD